MLLIYVPGERERVLKAPSPNICGEANIAEAEQTLGPRTGLLVGFCTRFLTRIEHESIGADSLSEALSCYARCVKSWPFSFAFNCRLYPAIQLKIRRAVPTSIEACPTLKTTVRL